MQQNLLKALFVYARTQNDSVIGGTGFLFSPQASPTFSYMGKHCVFFNAHDLDWLIFPIINYISEECEAVSFGPSLLHLRSRGVEQWGIIGWIMNRSFLTMYVTTLDMWPVTLHACENAHAHPLWCGTQTVWHVAMTLRRQINTYKLWNNSHIQSFTQTPK